MKKNIIYIGQWNRNTYNGHGKMWWYPNYEALENQDDTHAQTYTGDWINNKHQGSGEYYWPGKKQTFKGIYKHFFNKIKFKNKFEKFYFIL